MNDSDTNNLVERFFHSLKYTFSKGRVIRRVDDLLKLLLTEVFPFYVTARMRRTSGAEFTRAEAQDRRHVTLHTWLTTIVCLLWTQLYPLTQCMVKAGAAAIGEWCSFLPAACIKLPPVHD